MPSNNFYHIFCTAGERVIYEGRFQCPSRKAAITLLREKVGRRNLSGLTYSITEIPVDIIKEVVDSIINKKPVPEGDIITHDKTKSIPPAGFASIICNKRNPMAAHGIANTRRRLGEF